MHSLPDVADVRILRGPDAAEDVVPSLLIELPHGATRARHYHDTRAALRGPFPEKLDHFFFVNTDVGSPELGEAVARAWIARHPDQAAVLVHCQVPRTFIDCNRVIEVGARQKEPGDITPGLPPYVRDPDDQGLLIARHAAYQQLVDAWLEQVCEAGGLAVMMHTYAPRSVGVTVDGDIVQKLHDAYEPEVFQTWPLRPEVDIICRDLDGQLQAPAALLDDIVRRYAEAGVTCATGETYPLHPATTSAHRAARYPKQTLCVEVRRDLVVEPFTPFDEMIPDPERVQRMAAPIAQALLAYSAV